MFKMPGVPGEIQEESLLNDLSGPESYLTPTELSSVSTHHLRCQSFETGPKQNLCSVSCSYDCETSISVESRQRFKEDFDEVTDSVEKRIWIASTVGRVGEEEGDHFEFGVPCGEGPGLHLVCQEFFFNILGMTNSNAQTQKKQTKLKESGSKGRNAMESFILEELKDGTELKVNDMYWAFLDSRTNLEDKRVSYTTFAKVFKEVRESLKTKRSPPKRPKLESCSYTPPPSPSSLPVVNVMLSQLTPEEIQHHSKEMDREDNDDEVDGCVTDEAGEDNEEVFIVPQGHIGLECHWTCEHSPLGSVPEGQKSNCNPDCSLGCEVTFPSDRIDEIRELIENMLPSDREMCKRLMVGECWRLLSKSDREKVGGLYFALPCDGGQGYHMVCKQFMGMVLGKLSLQDLLEKPSSNQSTKDVLAIVSETLLDQTIFKPRQIFDMYRAKSQVQCTYFRFRKILSRCGLLSEKI